MVETREALESGREGFPFNCCRVKRHTGRFMAMLRCPTVENIVNVGLGRPIGTFARGEHAFVKGEPLERAESFRQCREPTIVNKDTNRDSQRRSPNIVTDSGSR